MLTVTALINLDQMKFISTYSQYIQPEAPAAASASISDIELAEWALIMKVALASERRSSQASATDRNLHPLSDFKEHSAFIASLVRKVVGT